MDEQQPRRERLEVPPTSQLERRLLVGDAAPRRPRAKPAIKPVPPSALLGKLQAFLPALEQANAQLEQTLQQQPAAEVVMERGSDDEREGPYVEMDLACGLFDLKNEAAVAAAERAMVGQGVAVERFGGASTDDSDSSSDEGSEVDEGEGGLAAAGGSEQGPSGGGGGDAMQEDGPAGGSAAAAGGLQQQQQGQQLGAAGLGRRRKGKGSKRHAGIEELS